MATEYYFSANKQSRCACQASVEYYRFYLSTVGCYYTPKIKILHKSPTAAYVQHNNNNNNNNRICIAQVCRMTSEALG